MPAIGYRRLQRATRDRRLRRCHLLHTFVRIPEVNTPFLRERPRRHPDKKIMRCLDSAKYESDEEAPDRKRCGPIPRHISGDPSICGGAGSTVRTLVPNSFATGREPPPALAGMATTP